MSRLRAWLGADPGGAPQAIDQITACTARQLLLGGTLVAIASTLGWQWRAYTWLALFLALLLPLSSATGLLLLMQRSRFAARGWAVVWACLLVLLPASAVTAGWLYTACLSRIGIEALNEGQVAATETLLVMLLLVLPLWMARRHASALRLAQLSQAALASDLKALQAQIEPHFLYNTLANARYLARHQPEQAADMLDHLIAYLRSALPDLRSPMSTLGRECELAGHYLALMAIRFGERLSVQIHCADDVHDLALPPLMLMPLVENAVQHGVEPHAGAVTVSVSARRVQHQVQVEVRDNGAGVGNAVLGSGVGLRNVRQRLEALYGPDAGVRLSMGTDGWTTAELTLPLHQPVPANT
jgi:signal transduction histidine kinase